jgi:hypothetical protein
MPIDVRMPDGTLVKNVPDNITQADLLARYNAFSAQPATSVAPEIQAKPQAPQVGPEGAPIPSILQNQEPPVPEQTLLQKIVGDQPDRGPKGPGARELLSDITAWKNAPEQIASAGIQAYQGKDPQKIAEQETANKIVEDARKITEANMAIQGAEDVYADVMGMKIKRSDVRNLPVNFATSVLAMGSALLTGLGTTIASAPVAGPAAPLVGTGAGAAAAGKVAYNIDTNNFLREFRDGLNQASIEQRGIPITNEEFVKIAQSPEMQTKAKEFNLDIQGKGAVDELANIHGLHEAGWEAISSTVGLGAGKYIFKEALKGKVLKPVAAFTGELGLELAGETATQLGQSNVERKAGMHQDAERSWSSAEDWKKSYKEVAGPTVLTTALLGGAPAAAGAAKRVFTKATQQPAPQERVEPEVTPPVTPEEAPATPAPVEAVTAAPTKIDTSHDTQAMLDELAGKDIEYIPEEEAKPTEIPKEQISNAKQLTKALGGENAQQLKDDFNPTYNYTNKDGVEVTFKEDGKVFNLVPGDEDTQVGSDIHLDYIGSKDRNKGLASKELDRIINMADDNNLSISLEVDKQDKNGLSNDQLKDWYQRKGFVFPRGNDIGYRPRPDESLRGYPEKTIQVPEDKIQDAGQQINSDLTKRTFSDEETFYEMFNNGSLEEGYQAVPTESAPKGYDEVYYYDGKNKPVRVSDVYARYDAENKKVVIDRLAAEPTGVISETEKEFTPVGGRLINKADAARLARESAIALEQNLKNQEIQRDKQIRREIREDKFPAAKTPSLASALKSLGGINQSNKLDMLKDTGKVFNYESAFSKDGEDLLTYIENGSLDEYLPHQLRLSNTPPNEAFDARPAYDYISSVIESKQKVHDYDYELAKIDHENKIKEKYLAKQYMEPNEAAQAAAAEIQGKEYMNVEVPIPKVTEQELLAQFSAQAQEYISEMPIFESAKETKSFKIEMNKLRRAIKKGMVKEADIIPAIDQIYESTQKDYEPLERKRGAEIVKEKLLAAKRRKELSPEAVDMALFLIDKNPALVKDLAISITASKRDGKAGGYAPLARLATIFKYTPNNETAVHEILHHLERMMPKDIQAAIRKAWARSLKVSAERAFGGKNETLKQYYRDVIDYHTNGDEKAEKRAMSLLAANTVGYEHYQNFNPSEFWAINGSSIVQNRYNADISESMVERIKNWLSEFVEKVKALFNLQSDAAVIRALNSVAKGDGKFITDMIHEGKEYAVVNKPPRNIKGQEVIPQWHGPEESKLDTWLYRLQNKQIDTKRVQELIGDIEEDWNVYDKEQLYHGRTAAGIRNFLLKELLPIIKEIERLKISPEDVRTYLHNRHAEERNIQMNKINPDIYDETTGRTIPNPLKDKGSGISTPDARAYLAGLDPARKQVLEQIATKFDQMVKGTQQILINSGAESADTIAKWNSTYEHYVPLFRVEDEMARPTGMGGTGQGFGVRGAFSKRAMGSEKDVQDILSNIIAQRERALIRAEKIRVGRALYGLAIQNPNPDFWLAINPDAIRNRKQAIAELRRMGVPDAEQMIDNLMAEPKERYLKKTRAAEEGFEPDEDFDFDSGLPVNESKEVVASKVNVMARYKDFVFPVRINGKDRYIFFNKNDPRALRMVQSLKNLDVENLGYLESVFGKFTRWFKNVNTQYNPVFGLVNFVRDFGGTLLNLTNTEIKGKQAQVIAGAYKAMGGILNVHRAERKGKPLPTGPWAKLYQEARDEGFQTGYRDSLIRNQEEMQIVEHTLSQFKDGNTKKAFYAVLGGLTDYNDMMENAFRLSAYKVARDQGLSKQKAAIIAKNLTVNFDRKGAWTSSVNALYAFFNASVQGTERIYQTIKGPKGKMIIGGGILAGMVQAVMLAAAGYGDDDPPEFVRERNFIIPLVDGTYLTVPYPLGYNILPNSGRIVMDFMIHGGRNPGKHMTSLMSSVMNSFNPLGSSGFAIQTLMPTAIDPIVALAENKDSFGRPIYRPDRATAPTPGYTRSRDTASTLGKGIAEFLNWASGGTKYQKGSISPTGDEVDFLAGQVGGGLYREVTKAGKAVSAAITGEEIPSYQRPVVGRFLGSTGSPAAVSQTFYNNVTRMTDHENEIKGRMKNREDVEGYLNDNPEARLWKRANTIENKINELNKRKRMFIDRGFPKERIQAVDAQKTLLMQRFNDQVSKLTPE